MTDRQDTAPRAQRARLGAELRRLRMLAGLSGRQVSDRVGIGQASVSRIENGNQVPSLPEVTAWAHAVSATDEQRTSLMAMTEAALNEVESWRARMRAGLPAMQADTEQLEATSRRQRCFQPTLIPGLLQAAEYARQVFGLVDVLGGGDYQGAVAARMQRQQALYDSSLSFEFLITEAALRRRIVPANVLATQLAHIATVDTLGNVSIGVIPSDAEMQALPWCGFNMYEDRDGDEQPFVAIEMPHASLTVSDPADVEIYRDQLKLLWRSAVDGDEARSLLTSIAEELRRP